MEKSVSGGADPIRKRNEIGDRIVEGLRFRKCKVEVVED